MQTVPERQRTRDHQTINERGRGTGWNERERKKSYELFVAYIYDLIDASGQYATAAVTATSRTDVHTHADQFMDRESVPHLYHAL